VHFWIVIESAWPRTIAASRFDSLRGGSGSRALPGARPGRSAANETSSSGCLAIARKHDVTARLNGSVGASRLANLPLLLGVVITKLTFQSDSLTRHRQCVERSDEAIQLVGPRIASLCSQ
jgi:hypothetical protein